MGELTRQVEDIVRGWIDGGELTANQQLSSERTLSADLKAGRTTIRLVLTKLAAAARWSSGSVEPTSVLRSGRTRRS